MLIEVRAEYYRGGGGGKRKNLQGYKMKIKHYKNSLLL